MKTLEYFGCIGKSAGHYWANNERRVEINLNLPNSFVRSIDGLFVPTTKTNKPYLYQESNVGNVRIVSWIDYSVDERPGSHSTICGIGYSSAEEMIDDAIVKFPNEMKRQPRPRPITDERNIPKI